jgi:nucleotide-binding universal stress UspA family protein
MTKHGVVVGVDGSAASDAATAVACAEAADRRLPLTLVHAWEAPYPVFAEVGWMPLPIVPDAADLEAIARQTLASTAELVARLAPDLDVDARLIQSPPTEALLEASRTSTLLVVGGVDRGRQEVGWLGPVPLHVAGHARCPVIVVPTGARADGPVVVGVDDGGRSGSAVAFAFEQAERWRRELIAVHALSSTWAGLVTDSAQLAQLHERARADLSELLAGWGEKYPDVRVTDVVSTEHSVRALRSAATDASLLVLGSHSRGTATRYAPGSISTTLLRVAPCAVAVVTTEGGSP